MTTRRNADNHPRLCSVGDCTNTVHSRGYCRMHYMRWSRNGSPLIGARSNDNHPWKSRLVNDPRRAIPTARNRLDLRINDETRSQLNDLLTTSSYTLTGIVSRAIAEYHQRHVTGTPMHAPNPTSRPAVAMLPYTCRGCGHRGAYPATETRPICVICDDPVGATLYELEG